MLKSIKNEIIHTNKSEIQNIKTEAEKFNYFIGEIDEKPLHTWQEYSAIIEKIFKFPTSCIDSIDRYLDWMRDLEWLKKDGYALIIYNYSIFTQNAPELAHDIIEDFRVAILPFWEEEVSRVFVEGKPKPFMVYLID